MVLNLLGLIGFICGCLSLLWNSQFSRKHTSRTTLYAAPMLLFNMNFYMYQIWLHASVSHYSTTEMVIDVMSIQVALYAFGFTSVLISGLSGFGIFRFKIWKKKHFWGKNGVLTMQISATVSSCIYICSLIFSLITKSILAGLILGSFGLIGVTVVVVLTLWRWNREEPIAPSEEEQILIEETIENV